jgi:hypothetical protein
LTATRGLSTEARGRRERHWAVEHETGEAQRLLPAFAERALVTGDLRRERALRGADRVGREVAHAVLEREVVARGLRDRRELVELSEDAEVLAVGGRILVELGLGVLELEDAVGHRRERRGTLSLFVLDTWRDRDHK